MLDPHSVGGFPLNARRLLYISFAFPCYVLNLESTIVVLNFDCLSPNGIYL
jgi:hypothetical protein